MFICVYMHTCMYSYGFICVYSCIQKHADLIGSHIGGASSPSGLVSLGLEPQYTEAGKLWGTLLHVKVSENCGSYFGILMQGMLYFGSILGSPDFWQSSHMAVQALRGEAPAQCCATCGLKAVHVWIN